MFFRFRYIASAGTLALVAGASRSFLITTQTVSTDGLDKFLRLLDERAEQERQGLRRKGLLTGGVLSNHISVMDDPLMWGLLPYRYMLSPVNLRWSMGSADLCFTNPVLGTFFSLGQVIPTFRLHKDPRGGLFQPAVREAIGILQSGQWMHIYPEGRVHQHPTYQPRYFRWGISRLILEMDEAPDVLPIFVTGFDQIMHESRTFPRFLPRVGKTVRAVFGDIIPEKRWEDVRAEWKKLCEEHGYDGSGEMPEELKHGKKAVKLRIETTWRVRQEVLNLRRREGYEEEDADAGSVEKYKEPETSKEGQQSGGIFEKDDR